MANFTTHIAVGTVASGLLSTMVMAANIVSPEQLLTLAAAGTLGSILPDVDLKDSRPSQAMFSLLAVFIAFAVLFNIGWRYSIAEMWILWAVTFLGVKFIGGWIFHRLSYHRGIYHSLLAGAFFAFLTAAIYRHVLGANETLSWLGGMFMFAGYLVHLTLDEMYSVDVMDVRVKSSFGTALKLYDTKHLGHSAAMAVATVLAFLVTPPFWASWKAVSQPEIRAGLQERLLPKQTWFGFIAKDFRMPSTLRRAIAPDAPADNTAAKAALAAESRPAAVDASPITTGSISQPAAPASPDSQSPAQTDTSPTPVR
jgi:ABC-type multidrug transport system fused ATPase/permease subunit